MPSTHSVNMSLEKVRMPEQAPGARTKNFEEVARGYTAEIAVEEARRCLGCKNRPCVAGCPVYVKIPEFISLIAEGKFEEGYQTIRETNSLPAVCGRVCPQETQCEELCVRGKKGDPVAIGRLERFAADYHLQNNGEPGKPHALEPISKTETVQVLAPASASAPASAPVPASASAPASAPTPTPTPTPTLMLKPRDHKVAIVGSGPAGLTCAGDLRQMGYDVTIFEAFHMAGGVLVYGIPEFRLPKEIVRMEINALKAMGVVIETNIVIGKTITIDELFAMGFKAVFIGTGAGLPTFMNIEGEALLGVYSANEYLTRINLMRAYDANFDTPIVRHRRVAVVGGGNVAMDAARCAARLGAEKTYIVYRRSMTELPARAEEVHHAKEEGVVFKLLSNPIRILGDKNRHVRGIECVEMELGEPDASGRRRPVAKAGSCFEMPLDAVVMAIGTSPNPLISKTTEGLRVNKWGCVAVDEKTMATDREGVYAGGDAVTGAATVILAMGAGKTAANSIDRYISG